MTLNIASHFKMQSEKNPDQPFLLANSQQLTFDQFWSASRRLATAMQSLGIRQGDRVAICLPNSVEAMVSLAGTLLLGAVAVPLPAGISSQSLDQILQQTRAIGLIARHEIWSEHLSVLRRIRSCLIHIVQDAGENNLLWESVWRWEDLVMFTEPNIEMGWTQPQDTAVIFYAEEGSDQLRQVPLSHLNLHYLVTRLSNRIWFLSPADRLLSTGNTNFSFANILPLVGAVSGATTVLIEKSEPETILETIKNENISLAVFDRTLIHQLLLNQPAGALNLSGCHVAILTAYPLSPALVDGLKSRFNVRLSTAFALFNAIPLTLTSVDAAGDELKSHGRPVLGTEIEVRDPGGARLPAYQRGYIFARGPQLNPECDVELHEAVGGSEWINTGHSGYLDKAGNLFLTQAGETAVEKPVTYPEKQKSQFSRARAWAESVYGR